MKILWLGGVFNHETLYKYPAANPAANRWTNGLLSCLKKQGHKIFIVCHRPEPYWPKGQLIPGNKNELSLAFNGNVIRYVNLLFIRRLFLSYAYWHAVKKVSAAFGPDVIIAYNPYQWNNFAGKRAIKILGVPWVPVILDLDAPDKKWIEFRKNLCTASGFVWLSYWGFQNQPLPQPKLHLDAGAEQWLGNDKIVIQRNPDKIILYAGNYSHFTGVVKIAEIVKKIQRKDVKIFLCGKGSHAAIDELARTDGRVRWFGFIDNGKLHDLHLAADVFLNVRPSNIADNRMIFPSKIVNYLSYGKPVVSSWTDGLAPEYRNLLQIPRDESAEAFAEKISETLDWSEERLKQHMETVKNWFSTHTWNVQAERLVKWLKLEIVK